MSKSESVAKPKRKLLMIVVFHPAIM